MSLYHNDTDNNRHEQDFNNRNERIPTVLMRTGIATIVVAPTMACNKNNINNSSKNHRYHPYNTNNSSTNSCIHSNTASTC